MRKHMVGVTVRSPTSSSRRLLLAEDNVVNQKVALALLGKIGYEADVVNNGAEAVEALAKFPYAAVLMDCQMPRMDGYEATAEIRKRQKGSGHVPIIAMTAAAMMGDKEKCLAAGMDDYLSKPVTLNELQATLGRWVGPSEETVMPREHPGAPNGSKEAIDPARIEELRAVTGEGKRDAFLTLAEIFRADGRARLSGIREAIAKDDIAAVAKDAHALRGAAGNLGAMNLADRCKDLEQLASSGSLGGSQDLLEKLEAEHQRVEEALASHLKTKSN